MKKNFASRLICLALAAVMCMGLAACGSTGGEKPAGTATSAPQAEPEYVYTSQFKQVKTENGGSLTIRRYKDGLYYATAYEKVGENIPEGVTPEWEGQYDVYSTFLYTIDENGKLTKLDGYTSIEPEQDTDGRFEFSSSSYLEGICYTDDGFVTLDNIYSSWFDADVSGMERYGDEYWSHQKYRQRYILRRFDSEGNELSSVELPAEDGHYYGGYNMKLDDKGNVVLIYDGTEIKAIAPDGSEAYSITPQGDLYIDTIIELADGQLAVSCYKDGQQLYLIDTENGKLEEQAKINANFYSAVPGSGEWDFYYVDGTSFRGYNLAENKSERLFGWLECDVNSNEVNVLNVEDDGTVHAYCMRYDEKDSSFSVDLIKVQKTPAELVPKKETITMAITDYVDYNVQNQIIAFNRGNDKYRIDIADYSQYNNEDDWSAGTTKLNTEILSGNIPDIFCLSGLSYRQLAAKGILEDLYPYIENDKELNRDDFFPNLLAAYEVDGKLCSTVSSFYVGSLMGAASVVGDEPGWTYDEFYAALASMPEGCAALDQYVTRDSILNTCLALDMDSFVDWGSGKCSFDSEAFIKLLEFAATFPAEYNPEDGAYYESPTDRISQGKQMLIQTSAFSIEDIFYNNYTQFLGGKATYIGYPCYSGTGNIFYQNESGYAMSSKSPYKDAIWDFLRTFFTADYQRENVYSFTSRVDIFEEKANEAMTVQYEKDAEGNFRLDDKGEKIPVVRYYMWNEAEGKEEKILAVEPEQVAQIRALIDSTSKMFDYNESIIGIVSAEVPAFFEGQKSAADVARLIQSKANIYVNEQR